MAKSNKLANMDTEIVKVVAIADNPANARKVLKDIASLATSIKLTGLRQPPVLRRLNINVAGDAELMKKSFTHMTVEGMRRVAALRLNETPEVTALIHTTATVDVGDTREKKADTVAAMIADLADNNARDNLTTYETARRISEIETESGGMKTVDIAKRIGMGSGVCQNWLRVYKKLDPRIMAVWANPEHASHGLLNQSALFSIVKHDKHEDQWNRWVALCGGTPPGDAGAEGGGDGTSPAKPPKGKGVKKLGEELINALATKKPLGWELARSCVMYMMAKGEGVSIPFLKEIRKSGKRGGK